MHVVRDQSVIKLHRVGWCIALVYTCIYIYIFVSMGSPFGLARAPVNAQCANVRPAE